MIAGTGCFSYHRTTTETPAQVAPSEPPSSEHYHQHHYAIQRRKREGTFHYDVRAVSLSRCSRMAELGQKRDVLPRPKAPR